MSLLPNSTSDSLLEQAAYLRTLPAIRERCTRVHTLAQKDGLQYFEYHPENEQTVVDFCAAIIERDFGTNYVEIPPHGRWRHLDSGRPRIQALLNTWASSPNPPDTKEICRRLVDLFIVSVLLDAGAGPTWGFTEDNHGGKRFTRSEGLAVASFDMFASGMFSSDEEQPYQVDAKGLSNISTPDIALAMQVSDDNPMVGIEGRAQLLQRLGGALKEGKEFFGGGDNARLGNLLDFLEAQSVKSDAGETIIPVSALWAALIEGLNPIWPPSRTSLGGVSLGDVWPCEALRDPSKSETASEEIDPSILVPFHKLTGWTTYSVIEPIEKVLGWKFEGKDLLTGLPEYRNGGLLMDHGVLTLKSNPPRSLPVDEQSGLPRVSPAHPAVIEWRAMTVIELQVDRIAEQIRTKLGLDPEALSLAQVLESATWKGGREIAKIKRPATGGPPLEIESDGTVF
ncbi:hypothetical protein PC9H_002066 [Pleurotus ostreatus]|uniref:DUF1688-domain-containing protein n=1 Tax=Pleurotus ostreatus TaxID=5322 RepID=A0A8H6ZPN2_PLEOS|nr:uncharacterized protein PC9H_002066 [Pleurotus ostreatus]KAF7419475.1 hypothetical protein PC9H_002066 [Pleurotus ostreatus]